MNILKKIDDLLKEIESETKANDVEFELNIWTDKPKAHEIKEKLIKDAEEYEVDCLEHYDNEHWISISIGSLEVSIWHETSNEKDHYAEANAGRCTFDE